MWCLCFGEVMLKRKQKESMKASNENINYEVFPNLHSRHYVLKTSHPSGLSYDKGFSTDCNKIGFYLKIIFFL